MTIVVNNATEALYMNTVLEVPFTSGLLELQSQYSKQTEQFEMVRALQNARYTVWNVTFGEAFKDEHKSGIYWARIVVPSVYEGSWFLVKLITEPGGGTGISRYISDDATENRVAEVFYRPNY